MAHAKDIAKDDHPTSSRAMTQLSRIRKTLPLRVLSDADFAHWQKRSSVVAPIKRQRQSCLLKKGGAVGSNQRATAIGK